MATTKRNRKKLPEWISVVNQKNKEAPTCYEDIPSQSVADALRFCRSSVMKERLVQALQDATREGLVDEETEKALMKELTQL